MKMKKMAAPLFFAVLLGAAGNPPEAQAAEKKTVAVVGKIVMAEDGKSARVELKGESGEGVTILVSDEATLDKFRDHKIVEGDEVRCKYDDGEGKNVSRSFRKTAGC